MRVMVFFDLPTITAKDRRQYRFFKKFLAAEGFIMMQESVYCKLVLNYSAAEAVLGRIKKTNPKDGIIQVMTITEKQFAEIEYVIGGKKHKQLDSMDRIVEI